MARPPQFRLRTLLGLVAMIAVVIGAVAGRRDAPIPPNYVKRLVGLPGEHYRGPLGRRP